MTHHPAPGSSKAALWRPLVGLAIDYLRWTQLVPMVMAWAFLAIMVLALVVTNFQQQSFAVVGSALSAYEWAFGPIEPHEEHPAGTARPETEQAEGAEGVRFDEQTLRPWILKIWGGLALVFWLLGLLRAWLFGTSEPATLRRKLALAAVAAVISSAICFACWLFGSERFNGGPAGWIALFLGAPLLVWLVSAWSLSVGHGLDALGRKVTRSATIAE